MRVRELNRRKAGLSVVAALAIVLLTACAPPSTPTPLPSQLSRLAQTPVAPSPRLSVDCDGILSPAQLTGALTAPVHPTDRAVSNAGQVPEMAPTWVMREAGGLACEWSNAVAYGAPSEQPKDYRGLTLSALPDAAGAWKTLQRTTLLAGTRYVRCSTTLSGRCSADILTANNVWMSAVLTEPAPALEPADVTAAFEAVLARAQAAIEAATVGASTWMPPRGAIRPATPCPDVLRKETIKAAVGAEVTVILPFEGWDVDVAASSRVGHLVCTWTYGGPNKGVLVLSWLAGGSWAWDRVGDPRLAYGTPRQFAVRGIGADGGAWMRCSADGTSCATDIVVDGNWLEFTLSSAGRSPLSEFDPRIASEAIAAEIVLQVTQSSLA